MQIKQFICFSVINLSNDPKLDYKKIRYKNYFYYLYIFTTLF